MNRFANLWPFVQIAGLIIAGVGVEHGVLLIERLIPRTVYFEPSITLALLAHARWLLVPVLVLALPLFWRRSERLRWDLSDSVGGMRWAVVAIAAAISWSYIAHPVNHYFGQEHAIDRWLLLGATVALLRSPILLPLFMFELAICRGQLRHPIGSLTPIGDELPLRLLGMVTAAALVNLLARTDAAAKLRARWQGSGPVIATPILITAMFCLVGGYYGYAGYAKLTIGESPIDWMLHSHLENLFVSTYLKGWQWVGDVRMLLDWAPFVASVAPWIAGVTILLECGMVFLLVHRKATFLLLCGVMGMHLGIVALTGIFFWKWIVVDLALGLWLWSVRGDERVDSIYSRNNAVTSVVVIVSFIAAFGLNEFTWWSTKRMTVLEVHGHASDGSTCVVHAEEFSPYMLVDYLRPEGAVPDTFVFGSTLDQKLMERTESLDPAVLRASLSKRRAENKGASRERSIRSVENFMRNYFKHRNRAISATEDGVRHVFPFVLSPPLIHMSWRHEASRPRCTAPIEEISIRNIESYFTGETLVPLIDQEIHRVSIPAVRSTD